ncbi:MAG: GHKL domain-containing protein [Ruminococcaceae bacterium]|nr:GHKL domain-containing protein [Oscillospiraceae bacterium]
MVWAELFHCIIEFAILLQFSRNYLNLKKHGRYLNFLAVLIASAGLLGINQLGIGSLNTVVSVLLATVLLHFLFDSSIMAEVGISFFYVAILVFADFITSLSLSAFLNRPVNQIIMNAMSRMIAIVTSRIALIMILRIISTFYQQKRFYYKHNQIDKNTAFLLALPFVSLYTAYLLLYFEQWIPSTFFNGLWLSGICFGLLLVNLIVFNIYDTKIENSELKNQLQLAQKYQNYQDQAYRKQEQYLFDMEALAHDFKHHLVSIEGMLDRRDDDLKEYLNTLNQSIDSRVSKPAAWSTNRAFNVIVYQKQKECEEYGIELNLCIKYGDLAFLNYSDTCAIFGNALDNAIAACRSITDNQLKKYIKLSISRHNDLLLIDIENSKNEFEKIIESDEGLKTTKRGEHHGFGFTNLKSAVLRNGGTALYDYSDRIFTLMITLGIKNSTLKNEHFVNEMSVRQ